MRFTLTPNLSNCYASNSIRSPFACLSCLLLPRQTESLFIAVHAARKIDETNGNLPKR